MPSLPNSITEDLIARLRLIRSENIGPQTFKQLINLYGDAASALQNLHKLSSKGGRTNKLKICDNSKAVEEIEKLNQYGANLLFWDDPTYPISLSLIPDAPPVLTIKGNDKLLNADNIVGIVGSRSASTNGLTITKEIAQNLSSQNIVIVSGLARGIDACAHENSLKSGSIGVIACGINVVYPSQNKTLYEKVSTEGIIITEYPFNCEAYARNFPQRNRIISGLSKAIVVVEASLKSGSLITAHYAIKHQRKLFAVPGSMLDSKFSGSNQLIKKGQATLMSSYQDILEFLEKENFTFNDCNQSIIPTSNKILSESKLDKFRSILHNTLSFSPTSIEDIIISTNIPYSVINVLLLEMELAGRIERNYGNKITRIA